MVRLLAQEFHRLQVAHTDATESKHNAAEDRERVVSEHRLPLPQSFAHSVVCEAADRRILDSRSRPKRGVRVRGGLIWAARYLTDHRLIYLAHTDGGGGVALAVESMIRCASSDYYSP